jgi:hypothetical protein
VRAAGLVPAVGGTRRVPVADAIARDYILLGLRLDQHTPGVVDSFFGPADLKALVDMEQRRSPALLRSDAMELAERIDREAGPSERKGWLLAQLVALEAQIQALGGDPLPYVEQVTRYMGFAPIRVDDDVFEAAAAAIDGLLPGPGTLDERLAAWDSALEIPADNLLAVADWLVGRFRDVAATAFGLPEREGVRVSLVHDQPWTAYNWYDGGRRSRIDFNTDLPMPAPYLVHVVAHETYPGHHLEQAWKEADLVDGEGRLEASILLINTPESPISEGLADIGESFAVPVADRSALLVELFERADLALATDAARAHDTAERAVVLATHRQTLGSILGNAALRRHADGASRDLVHRYLCDVGRYRPDVAAKRLEFIEHPLWRTYAFVYAEGEALLRRWIEAAPATDRVGRFGRLLHQQVTPGRLLAELG